MSTQAAAAPRQYTVHDVIDRYVRNRDAIDAIRKRHAEELKPYNDRKVVLESWLMKKLLEDNVDSVKTDAGTAYKTLSETVSIDQENNGWEKLLDYIVLKGLDAAVVVLEMGGSNEDAIVAFRAVEELNLINRSANPTAVKEFIDKHNQEPPGVRLNSALKIGIRRS